MASRARVPRGAAVCVRRAMDDAMEGMMAQDTTTKGETSAFRAAEKAYKRDGKRPYLGLSEQQLNGLLDFEECAPPLLYAALACMQELRA